MAPIDDSYRLLAARYLRRQARALRQQIDGTRKAEDVECLHQARVASRRLRSGLRMFGGVFARKKRRTWRRRIRRLTSGLGLARDCDVQILFLQDVLAGLGDESARAGIERLLLRLGRQREALQRKVVKALDRLDRSGVLKDIRSTTKAMISDLTAEGVAIQSPLVFLRAERMILRRLEKLLPYQDCLDDPADKPRHHAMRIVTKRLRYTMEICGPVYEGALDEAIEAAKDLQTALGEVHDCDVWMDQLPIFAEAERERTREYFGDDRLYEQQLRSGIEHLDADRRSQRDEAFAAAGEQWRRIAERGLWDKTIAAVLSRVNQAAPPADTPAPPPPDEPPDDEAPTDERSPGDQQSMGTGAADPADEPPGDRNLFS